MDSKCAGKLLEVSGTVAKATENVGGEPLLRFSGSDERFEVNCVMRSFDELEDVVVGEMCRIRGVYSVSTVPMFIYCSIARTNAPQTGRAIDKSDDTRSNRGAPQVVITPEEFDSEIAADVKKTENFEATTKKYHGKVVQITGRLSRISHVVFGEITYKFHGKDASDYLGVQCFLRSGSPWFCVLPGQTVTLVGEGFRSYPCLVNCDVISVSGAGDPPATAKSLGEMLENNRAEFKKRFYLQQLIVTGEVIKKSPAVIIGQVALTLRSTAKTRIVCEMDETEFMGTESVKVGDSVTILGWDTHETPEDSVTLARCLFWRGD